MTNKLMIAAAFSALIAPAALAQTSNYGNETKTAATHAGLAAQAGDLKTVQMHLHHALNCLEGPSGKDFDQSNANPCAKMGKGALTDANPAQAAQLQTAITTLNNGVATTDLATAKKDGTTAAADINKAM